MVKFREVIRSGKVECIHAFVNDLIGLSSIYET